MEHNLFPTDHFNLLFVNQQNIWQSMIFVTNSFVKKHWKEFYITQITTAHIYVRQNCAVHLPTYKDARVNYTYWVFTECINLCDVGENFSNTRNQKSLCYLNINIDPIANYLKLNLEWISYILL
jgi:hypothetical protein